MINIQDEKNQLLITCLWLNLVICIIDHFTLVKKIPLFSPTWFLCSLLIFTRVLAQCPVSIVIYFLHTCNSLQLPFAPLLSQLTPPSTSLHCRTGWTTSYTGMWQSTEASKVFAFIQSSSGPQTCSCITGSFIPLLWCYGRLSNKA